MRRQCLWTIVWACSAAGAVQAQAHSHAESQAEAGRHHVDITSWRQAQSRHDAFSLVQRRDPAQRPAEMHIPASRGMVTELRAVGVQLDGGAKLLLRSRKGGPTIAYRNQF